MHIGILQAGHLPDEVQSGHGDYIRLYSELLAGHGLTFQGWDVVDMAFPASIHDADGWLISGSRHGAYEDLPFIPPLMDFVRAIHADRVPLVGICFGHQVMAQALGGRVEKFAGGWSVGHTSYRIGADSFAMNAWHQDQVTQAPKGARVTASTDFCTIAGLAYGDHMMSLQPHPEFPDSVIGNLLDHRARGVVPDRLQQDARAALGQPNDNARVGDMLAKFLLAAHQVRHA